MLLNFAECDRARLARDPAYDGRFFTGVRTTGVYCRPVCPVRPARSANVGFYHRRPRRRPQDPAPVCAAAPKPRHSVRLGRAHARPSSEPCA